MEMAGWYTKNVEEHYSNDAEKLKNVLSGNALKLFPRLKSMIINVPN
jgi:hypothetical protein